MPQAQVMSLQHRHTSSTAQFLRSLRRQGRRLQRAADGDGSKSLALGRTDSSKGQHLSLKGRS